MDIKDAFEKNLNIISFYINYFGFLIAIVIFKMFLHWVICWCDLQFQATLILTGNHPKSYKIPYKKQEASTDSILKTGFYKHKDNCVEILGKYES